MREKAIWFVRHAESEANAGLPSDDPGLIPITVRGHAQAVRLADELNGFSPELIVVSPYLRTQQTAQPLVDRLLDMPVAVWPLQEFDFLAPGQCVGTTVEQRRPWVKAYWECDDEFFVHGEGAECFRAFADRIIGCLHRLTERPESHILVFAHGHVMRLIWLYLSSGQTSMSSFLALSEKLPVPNTAVFKTSYEANHWLLIDLIKF